MDALPAVRKNVLFVRNENVDDLPIVGKNVPFVRNGAWVCSFLSTPLLETMEP